MRKIAIADSTVTLTANALWSWKNGRELKVRIAAGDTPFSIMGQSVLLGERVLQVLKEEILKQKYRHLPNVTRPGGIASVDVRADDSTLSQHIFLDGRKMATSQTCGTFLINTATSPSFIDPPPPAASVPDPLCSHPGSWRVEVPGPEICTEGQLTDRGSARPSRAEAGTGDLVRLSGEVDGASDRVEHERVAVTVSTWINEGTWMDGKKTEHVMVADFGVQNVMTNSKAFDTSLWIVDIDPVRDDFSHMDRWDANGVTIEASGAAGSGLGTIVGGIVGTVVFAYAWSMAAAIGRYITPLINYSIKVTLSADGSGSMEVAHNAFQVILLSSNGLERGEPFTERNTREKRSLRYRNSWGSAKLVLRSISTGTSIFA